MWILSFSETELYGYGGLYYTLIFVVYGPFIAMATAIYSFKIHNILQHIISNHPALYSLLNNIYYNPTDCGIRGMSWTNNGGMHGFNP